MLLIKNPWFINSALTICSVSALLIAFLFEHVAGLVPCELCWYQRYIYLIALIISVFNLLSFCRHNFLKYTLPLCTLVFFSGTCLAIYQVGVEQGWFAGPTSCSGLSPLNQATTIDELRRQLLAAPLVRCDEIAWSLFGLSIAAWNALFCAALTAVCTVAGWRQRKGASA